MKNRKSAFAFLSICSNSFLIVLKLCAGIVSGSVSIISEAIHSGMDLVAAIIAFFSVRISDIPPDKDHPFGHGKIENVSGVIEALLILLASVLIIMEAVKKLMHNQEVSVLGFGFGTMFVSAVINFFVSRTLYKVAKEEDSIALAADALHLKADVYTSLGVGIGLFLLWLTRLHFLDPVVAIVIALYIVHEAVMMLRNAFRPLLDEKLTDEEIDMIRTVLLSYKDAIIDFHELRTRRAGKYKHIDLHVTMPQHLSIKESHDICDNIERDLEQNIHNSMILIHAEPCEKACDACNSPIKNMCFTHTNK